VRRLRATLQQGCSRSVELGFRSGRDFDAREAYLALQAGRISAKIALEFKFKEVMRFWGNLSGGEMLPSIYAKRLAPCLGTVQAVPAAQTAAHRLDKRSGGAAAQKYATKSLDDLNARFKESAHGDL
jgi:hypothetical protein